MSDNKATKINEKIEIPKMRLWLIWLLLFVFPSLATIIAFNSFSYRYRYFEKTDLISNAFERIKEYKTKTVPENFLEEQLSQVKKLNSNQSLQELKSNIDRILCGETLFCYFFDKTLTQTTIIKSQICNQMIKNLPNSLLKKNLKKTIDNSFSDAIDQAKIKEDNAKLGNLLQLLFKSITPVTINLDKVSRNYSILFGGELYFTLCLFDEPNQNCSGFFAVLRGKEFSFHQMLENLHNSFPEIRTIFREVDIEKNFYNPEKLHSGIKSTKNGLYIISSADLKFARHVVYGGSDQINFKYGHLLPFIEYRIPTEKYEKRIQERHNQINLIAIIIISISWIYFLHISLFGFSDSLSFKTKIMFLALIAAIFPFSIFTLGIYGINEYNRLIEKTSILQHAETEIYLSNQELEQYKTELETKVAEYGIKISELLTNKDLKPSKLLSYLSEIGEDIPASLEIVYLKPMPENLEVISSKNKIIKKFPQRISSNSLDEEKDSLSNLFPYTLMKVLTDEEVKQKRERQDELEIGEEKLTSTFINDSLQNTGKISKLEQLGPTTWYILQQLQDNKDEDHKVIGIYIVKFENKPLLSAFLNNSSLQKKDFKENTENFAIDYAFIPIEKNELTQDIYGSKSIIKRDISPIFKNSQSGQIIFDNKVIIKKRSQYIPYLAIASIRELDNFNNNYFFFILIVSVLTYLSLIMFFASKLLDIMFVEPVMLLASNANAIARGSEKWEVEISSGDEFEDLNNEFKQLVSGLQERNILKSYVSEDAFSDIEETDSLKLLPGGEYLEATIVFSAIKDYDRLSASITPQESIKILSNFMSLAEEVSKKYGGSIDKIIGDTIMLVFRKNNLKDSHGLRAAKASLELVEKAKAVNMPKLFTGIASGRVISGRIGSYSGKLDFTVIGNPVNLAARFKTESKNGTEETGIIISGTTIGLMNGKANVRFLRRVSIKGKARKYNIYELLNVRE